MAIALAEFEIEGVRTTLPLQRFLVEHEELAKWNLDVQFLQRNRILESLSERLQRDRDALVREGAAIAAVILDSGIGSRRRMAEPLKVPRAAALPREARFYDTI